MGENSQKIQNTFDSFLKYFDTIYFLGISCSGKRFQYMQKKFDTAVIPVALQSYFCHPKKIATFSGDIWIKGGNGVETRAEKSFMFLHVYFDVIQRLYTPSLFPAERMVDSNPITELYGIKRKYLVVLLSDTNVVTSTK